MKKVILLIHLVFSFLYSYSDPTKIFQSKPDPIIKLNIHEGTNMAAALSPDKKTLALDLQGTIWILPVGGGEAIAVTDELGDCHEPSWSPDGNRIAFNSYRTGNYHIWTVKKDGSELRQITTGLYDDREPSWSPDGKTIVFSSDRKGNYDLWQVDLASNQVNALTSNAANEYNPAISPDGNSIAFVSERQERGVYILKDGRETLIAPSSSRLAAPSWNISGDKIMFVSYGRSNISQLSLVNLADKTKIEVTAPGEDIFPFRVSWLSDDTFLYTADGKIQKRMLGEEKIVSIPFEAKLILTRPVYERKKYNFDDEQKHTPMGIIGPVVSPDGNQVAFSALTDIYIQTIGGKILQVTNDTHVDLDPDWSPDGKMLAYISDRGGKMDVWIRDMRTGESRLLTRKVTGDALMPSWSADGRKIAFYSRDDLAAWGRVTLAVGDVATGEVQNIPGSLFFPSKPAWSNDGSTIAFMAAERYSSRYREGINEFCLVSLQGGPVRYVSPDSTTNPGVRNGNGPVWAPDGSKIAYVQDGVLWMVPVKSKGDIAGTPRQVTKELADKLSWSGDSKSIVYLAIDQLKKVNIETGRSKNISIDLKWKTQFSEEQYIIHAGKLFNGRDSTYLYNADILIDGHRIKSIISHQDHGKATVLDATGKVVMPGLFESHTHQQANDGEKLGKIWLSYGITSVRETGADPYDALERKESWSAGFRPGPRLFFTGALLDGNRVYYGLSSSLVAKPHISMELERAGRLGYSLIKTYVRMADPIQKEITVAAHKMGIPVSSHELYPATAYNVDGVEHLAGTSRRGYSVRQTALNKIYDDVLQLTSASGINITPTIVMGGFLKMAHQYPGLAENKQYKAFFSKNYIDSWTRRATATSYSQMEEYQKAVKSFVNSGGSVTAGTDSPQVPYGTSLHAELWLFVNGGLSPFQALQSATIKAAKAVGVDKDLGSIESGKLADLVIVDGDPLKNISDAWNVDTVIKNGIQYPVRGLLPEIKNENK